MAKKKQNLKPDTVLKIIGEGKRISCHRLFP